MDKTLKVTALGITTAVVGFLGGTSLEPVAITSLEEIVVEQQRVYDLTGEYTQITKGGQKMKDEYSSTKIKPGTEIHVYDGPKGKGYQIITVSETETVSVGFGAEAESRTWVRIKPQTSTTTEVIKLKI